MLFPVYRHSTLSDMSLIQCCIVYYISLLQLMWYCFGALGVTSEWVANGRDHLQTAANKVAAICGLFHAKIIIILSKLLLELLGKQT